MATQRRLARPPIVEALVDVRVTLAGDPVPDRFEPLKNLVTRDYPSVDERRGLRAEFRIESGKLQAPATQDLGFQGLFFRSSDKSRAVQFSKDGFTYNMLSPYSGGDSLLEEALRLWSLYVAQVVPQTVDRVALRYINRLSLPFREGDDFGRFLNSAPGLPDPAPQRVSEFLSRIVALDPASAAFAIVTQKLDSSQTGQPTIVTIDIDVFKQEHLAPSTELRPCLDVLRDLKNRTFFALVTDGALESYL